MRPATCLLGLGIALGLCLAVLPADSPAQANILPQIAKAVELQEECGPDAPPTLTSRFVEVSPGIHVAVKGKRERRQVRFARLTQSWRGDRRAVYEREGFPLFRHRESAFGEVTEHWTYPESNVTYVFRGNRLVRAEGS